MALCVHRCEQIVQLQIYNVMLYTSLTQTAQQQTKQMILNPDMHNTLSS